jgi:membrane protein implicated in regulation of membrane protease activity
VDGSQTTFVVVGVTGFLFLLISLLLGEFGGSDTELGQDADLGGDVDPGDVGHLPSDGAGGLDGGTDFGHDAALENDTEGAPEVEAPDRRTGSAGAAPPEPSRWSLRVIAASTVGFGATGAAAVALGAPPVLSWPVAAVGFAAVGAATHTWILKPLARQQYNSLLSRYSYVGIDAVVTLGIPAGGTGQVTFRDRSGARVTKTATSDIPDGTVGTGTAVRIVKVHDNGVVVHLNVLAS